MQSNKILIYIRNASKTKKYQLSDKTASDYADFFQPIRIFALADNKRIYIDIRT